MHFDTAKSRDVLCRACRTARRDMLVTTSATGATRTTRVNGRRHSVDWVGYVYLTFPEVFPETDAQKTKLVRASITASSSSAMLEQARLDTLDTLVTTRATWLSCCDSTSRICYA